jgi:hypothetical protein
MKITKLTFYKEMKIGLPNYSNITASHGMEVELEEGEKIDYDACWDAINQQLAIQSDGIDPGWIKTGEYKNFFKITVKAPK